MATLEIVFRAERQADGTYRGTVHVPAIPGAQVPPGLLPEGAAPTGLAVTATGKSKVAAVDKAAKLADAALSNPLIASVLPPQAKLALESTKVALKVGKKIGSKLRKLF